MRHPQRAVRVGGVFECANMFDFRLPSRPSHPPIGRGFARNPPGFPRYRQSRHPDRRAPRAGRHPVEPGGLAVRGAAAAGLSDRRHAGRPGGAGRHQIRRRAGGLYRGVGRPRADPVRRRAAHAFRHVPHRSVALGTGGVVVTAALTAPVARYALGLGWTESLLVGSVVASTDAAAVFFLIHARGLRLRPRVSATLEIESGPNDSFAIVPTLLLVELLLYGPQPWLSIAIGLVAKAFGGALIGILGGRGIVLVLNRLALPPGLHAAFVATRALVVFRSA